jgi:hypothetical protein
MSSVVEAPAKAAKGDQEAAAGAVSVTSCAAASAASSAHAGKASSKDAAAAVATATGSSATGRIAASLARRILKRAPRGNDGLTPAALLSAARGRDEASRSRAGCLEMQH